MQNGREDEAPSSVVLQVYNTNGSVCVCVLRGYPSVPGRWLGRHRAQQLRVVGCDIRPLRTRNCYSPYWSCCMTLGNLLKPVASISPAVKRVAGPNSTHCSEKWEIMNTRGWSRCLTYRKSSVNVSCHDSWCSGMKLNVLANFKNSVRAHHTHPWLKASVGTEDWGRSPVLELGESPTVAKRDHYTKKTCG